MIDFDVKIRSILATFVQRLTDLTETKKQRARDSGKNRVTFARGIFHSLDSFYLMKQPVHLRICYEYYIQCFYSHDETLYLQT